MDLNIECVGVVAMVTFTPSAAVAPAKGALLSGGVQVQSREWSGHYPIDTRNMTSGEIVAEVQRLQDHHVAKTAVLNAFASMVAMNLIIAGVEYRWRDCRVTERGKNAVALHLDVSEVATGAHPSTMPLELYYPDCPSIPDAAGIAALVAQAIAEDAAKTAGQAQKLAQVRSALGLT